MNQKIFIKFIPFVACLVIYLVGACMDVLEIDEAQYAEIAKNMFATGEYLKVYDLMGDYLDKPPLLFWTSALFFKLSNTWAMILLLSKASLRLYPLLNIYTDRAAT